jgi:hypothetical protein
VYTPRRTRGSRRPVLRVRGKMDAIAVGDAARGARRRSSASRGERDDAVSVLLPCVIDTTTVADRDREIQRPGPWSL